MNAMRSWGNKQVKSIYFYIRVSIVNECPIIEKRSSRVKVVFLSIKKTCNYRNPRVRVNFVILVMGMMTLLKREALRKQNSINKKD